MKSNLLPIAKEGWSYLGYSALIFVIASVADCELFQSLSVLSAVFFIYVFRNPERELPRFEQSSVISPVDGRILSVDEINEGIYAYKITVNSNFTDVAVLRSPVSGKIKSVSSFNGSALGKDSELSTKLNEKTDIVFEDADKNSLKVLHMVKQSFDGIKVDAQPEQSMIQSSRYGVMLNGITTIYLPQNFRLNVSNSDEIKSGETLIGYFS